MTKKANPHTSVMKEMGFTHHDFYDKLPDLLGGIPFQRDGDQTSFSFHDGQAEIHLEAEQTREIGPSIHMPYTVVRLDFYDCTATQVDDFVRHFNLVFMRGGG